MKPNFKIGGRRDIDDFGDPDDITLVSDLVSQVREEDNGFTVISFSLGLPKKTVYTCRVYVNNHTHTPADPKNKSSITNAELAAMFFMGKWSGWFNETVLPALMSIKLYAEYKIKQQTSEQTKELKKEYNARIRSWKKSPEFKRFSISLLKNGGIIDKDSKTKTITTVDESGNGIIMPIDQFVKATKLHKPKFGWTKSMEEEYQAAKKSAWYKTVINRVRSAEEKDPILAQLIIDPYKYGAFVSNIVNECAKEARDRVEELILGSKSPGISDRTKKNRRWRGNPEDPPLNETGEFAQSVEYEVTHD